MLLTPLLTLIKNRQFLPAIRINALFKPFYKISYLAGAKKCGLLDALSTGPLTFDDLAKAYCQDAKACEALQAWLQLGIRPGFLSLKNNIYYFPFEERVSLLRHLKKFIKPGGFLLLTTCCQGGNLGIEVLNL
jgi:hypothetical protein